MKKILQTENQKQQTKVVTIGPAWMRSGLEWEGTQVRKLYDRSYKHKAQILQKRKIIGDVKDYWIHVGKVSFLF